MWDLQRLTTLWAFTASYRDSFAYFFLLLEVKVTVIFELAKKFPWVVGWEVPVPPLCHPSSLPAGAHYLTCRRINEAISMAQCLCILSVHLFAYPSNFLLLGGLWDYLPVSVFVCHLNFFSFSMRSTLYKMKLGNWFLPGLLVHITRSTSCLSVCLSVWKHSLN